MKNEYLAFYKWAIITLFVLFHTIGHSQEARLVDLLRADACSKYRYRISNPTVARLTVQIDPGDGSPVIHTVLPAGKSTFVTKKVSRLASVTASYSREHYEAELQSYERAINEIVQDAKAAAALIGGIQEGIRNSPDVSYTYVEDWYGNVYVREQNHGFGKRLWEGMVSIYNQYQMEEAKNRVLAIAKKAAQAEKLYSMSNESSSASRMIYNDVVESNNYRLFNPSFIYDFAFVSIIGGAGLNDTWSNRRGAKMTFSFGLPGEIRWGRNSSFFTRFYIDGIYETLKFKLRETGEYYLNASLLEGAGQADLISLPNNEEIHLRGRRFGGGARVRTQFGKSIYASIGGGMLYSTNAKLIFDKETEYFKGSNVRLKENKADNLASLNPKATPYLAAELGLLGNKAGEGCRYYAQGVSFFLGGQVSRGQFIMEGDPQIFQNIDNEIVPAPFSNETEWMYNLWIGLGVNF